ncbi:MAG TPA: hypothetical protein PKG95_03845, partial [Anaerolineaceae bacterium]|nr:hypothetical protein [Anaerolineaceae bacterium]
DTHDFRMAGVGRVVLLLDLAGEFQKGILRQRPERMLPEKEAVLLGVTFTLVNLLEWPVLLSRGLFWALPLTIILRALLLLLLAVRFDQRCRARPDTETV